MTTAPTSARPPLARLLSDCLFVPLAVLYSFAAAAFGCSGSVSVGGNTPPDPNRALGTYEIAGTVPETESTIFFGYWIDGDSGIPPFSGQTLRNAIGPVLTDASISIVPNSILYEETATEIATGNTLTVSISGTWAYDGDTRITVNWGNAIVTDSTFPTTPTFALIAVGTQIQAPQASDLVFANGAWNQLSNVAPGPMDVSFVRVN
ncbi:MAG: hypothetical protein JNM94_05730 [Phycisphaerae bacterium]|nr:hypothetical protein [Phycisphaerae bacterium]